MPPTVLEWSSRVAPPEARASKSDSGIWFDLLVRQYSSDPRPRCGPCICAKSPLGADVPYRFRHGGTHRASLRMHRQPDHEITSVRPRRPVETSWTIYDSGRPGVCIGSVTTPSRSDDKLLCRAIRGTKERNRPPFWTNVIYSASLIEICGSRHTDLPSQRARVAGIS